MKPFFTQLLLAILVILFTCNSVSFADEQSLEHRLKALYIIRLADYISWPNAQKKTTFQICIEPADAIAKELEKITTTVINGRNLKIIPPPTDSTIDQCDFLYLSKGEIKPSLAKTPVVTISSQEGFAINGGMIEFYLENTKVRMKANLQSVNKAGISMSSKLLRLLKIVKIREAGNV